MNRFHPEEHRMCVSKDGFTLIELLIATFIASILGALLFSALYQVNRFVPVVDNTTAIYEKASLINAQLERDFSGTTAPNEFYYRQPEPEKKKKQETEKKQDEEKKKTEEAKKKEAGEAESEEKSEKKPKKPLEKIFYSTNKEGNLEQVSFITTNPMQVYWTAKTGSAKPRIARVQYVLKEEKGTPKSYSLIRKESGNLEFEPITKAQEQVLAEGIKSLTVEYTYYVPESPEKPKESKQEEAAKKESAAKAKEPKKRETKKTVEWIPQERTLREPQGERGREEPSQLPLTPQIVELKISLWDAQKKRSTPFTFKIRIPADIPEKRESEDVTQKLLGTLREFFTQSFTPPAPTRITQRNQFNLPRGQLGR